MSFSFEFVATQQDAVQIIEQEHAPETVKAFIQQALTAFAPESWVFVKALGHLYNKDYQSSNADIKIYQLALRVPKA